MIVHDDEKHDRFSSPVPPLPPRVTWNHRQFEPEAENTIRIHEAAFRRGLKNVVGLHVPVAPGLRVKPVDAGNQCPTRFMQRMHEDISKLQSEVSRAIETGNH